MSRLSIASLIALISCMMVNPWISGDRVRRRSRADSIPIRLPSLASSSVTDGDYIQAFAPSARVAHPKAVH